ncbi:MAG TPA: hypothetical protein VGP96_10550 [Candidatus Dormibacteraeota bacterium]|nr:hypothetical protein [Candidatus Dormibacteraeota bacterium]
MRRLHLLIWPGALVALCVGCGSAVTPATGGTATRNAPEVVEGQVVSNRGGTVTLASVDGIDSQVVATPRTPVTRIVTAADTDLSPGTCVVAGGGSTGGAVTVAWVLLEGPAGCAHPGAALVRVPAGLSTLEGTVQNVAGRLVSIQRPDGVKRFAITAAAALGRVLDATTADLGEGRCAVARGRQDGSGRLRAGHVTIVPPPAGGCFSGSGGVGALSLLEPRPGTGGTARAADSTSGGGAAAPVGVSPGGNVTLTSPVPVPAEPEGTGARAGTSPPSPPGGSAPPEFIPPPPEMPAPSEPPSRSTPTPRPGERGPAPSGAPGATGPPRPR